MCIQKLEHMRGRKVSENEFIRHAIKKACEVVEGMK